MLFVINQVNNTGGNNYFRVIGANAAALASATHIQVRNSTGNNGIYQVTSATDVTGYTHIAVQEPIPSAVADGQLNAGVYQIDFSSDVVPGKIPVILAPAQIDTTSLAIALPGRGSWNYGELLVENAVHVLENFASATAPAAPTIGQHWFDYATSTMKVWTGSVWSSDINIENGTLSFKDPQNATVDSKVFVTAAEPVDRADTGLTIYPEHDIPTSSPLLRVLSSSGDEHLSITRSDAVRTDLRFVSDSTTATSELKGKLSVGAPTLAYSTGSAANVKGHVDLSGKLILDETAAQHGIFGRDSNSSMRTVAGLWTIHSTNADSAVFINSAGEVARLGTTNVFLTPSRINNTLTVTGQTNLAGAVLTGTLLVPTVNVTTTLTTPVLTVTGTLSATATALQLQRNLDANNLKVINLLAPDAAGDATNKKYVDDNDYLSLMGDVTISSPADKQVLYFQQSTSRWINTTLDTTYISGFGGNVKDQAADMIGDGTHIGLTPTYNTGTKALSFSMNTRPISVTGDVSGTANMNWSGTTSLSLVLPATGIGAGTYTKVTYDAKGRGVSGGDLAVADIPALPASKITTGTLTLDTSGNAATATRLATARTINGVAFDGTANITVADSTKLPVGANAVSATRLVTSRTINGVLFNGTADIVVTDDTKLPVGANAVSATKLVTARTINGVAFDGTANITVADSTKLPTAGGTLSGALRITNTAQSTSSSTGALVVDGGVGVKGNIYADGNVSGLSDERLKTNIEVITGALAKVKQLDGVVYDRVDVNLRQAGLLAQQVQRVLPEAVSTNGEYLAVAYANVLGLLVEAIKELSDKVDGVSR